MCIGLLFLIGTNVIDRTLHVEILFGYVVVLAINDCLETTNRILERDEFAWCAGKDFSDEKRC
jgi:hypothetical protein